MIVKSTKNKSLSSGLFFVVAAGNSCRGFGLTGGRLFVCHHLYQLKTTKEVVMSKEKDGNWFKRHKVLTIIIGVIVLMAIVNSASGGDKSASTDKSASNSSTQSDAKTSAKTETLAKTGEAVRDGKFEFIVKGLECGKTSVGGEYLNKTAQGQYCLLNVSVKNIGTEKQSLFSSNQKLLNGETEYSADDTATLYAAPSGSSWYSDINPGNSVEGTIVFDVPKDVTPATAELHDSAYSDGVKVSLQ